MPPSEPAPVAAVAGESAPARRYTVFAVGEVHYALPAHQVRHTLPAGEVGGPAVVFLHQVYAVVDLRALFRLPAATQADRVVLLVEADGRRAGLVVDRPTDVVDLDAGAIVPLPAAFGGVERRWFAGLAALGQRVLVIVRADGVLDGRLAPRSQAAPVAAGA